MLKGSILQQLAIAHQASPRPLRFGVYYKNTLVALCHALEDSILSSNTEPLVIAAFQQGKWYLQEADRYAEIADRANHIVIMAASESGFAEHPTSQLSNVDLVGLDSADPVAQEWHLMIFSPTYTAMVICQELSEEDYGAAGRPAEDLERKFYGLWTFEPGLVRETVEFAIAHVGRYNTDLQKILADRVREISAAASTQQPEDLGAIVSRVVNYLQTSQSHLVSQHHALDNNLISNEVQAFVRMAQLMELADTGNPMATAELSALAEVMGQLLDLPAWQIKRLRFAGLLHGLVPLAPAAPVSEESAPCCPLVPGVQALRAMPRLEAIARIITHQTEWWNGSGSPAGLAYDAIPLESRILGLLAHFQHRVVELAKESATSTTQENLTKALAECQTQAGDRWDPKLVETLALLVMSLQQGLNLPVMPPKVSAGMWLLDSELPADAKTSEAIAK